MTEAAPVKMTYREAVPAGDPRGDPRRPPGLPDGRGRRLATAAATPSAKGLLEEFGPGAHPRHAALRERLRRRRHRRGDGRHAADRRDHDLNFSLLALDQILNNAATLPHMSGGQFAVPLVIRMATGAGRQLAAQHSHSLEGWYAHIPGLKVLAPATIEDARHMLEAALADPNPVLIFEHIMLYNMEGELDRAIDGGRHQLGQGAAPRQATSRS